MTSRLGFVCIFILGLIGGLLWYWPLETSLRLWAPPVVQWEQAQGRISKGIVRGASYARQPLGDIGWTWKRRFLFLIRVVGEASVHGDVAQGKAVLSLYPYKFKASDLDLRIQTNQLQNLNASLRAVEASINLEAVTLSVGFDGQCQEASGKIGTDLLSKLAQVFSQNIIVLNGELSCKDGVLSASFLDAETKDRLVLSLSGAIGEFVGRVRVETGKTSYIQALQLAGFKSDKSGGVYTYTHALSSG